MVSTIIKQELANIEKDDENLLDRAKNVFPEELVEHYEVSESGKYKNLCVKVKRTSSADGCDLKVQASSSCFTLNCAQLDGNQVIINAISAIDMELIDVNTLKIKSHDGKSIEISIRYTVNLNERLIKKIKIKEMDLYISPQGDKQDLCYKIIIK